MGFLAGKPAAAAATTVARASAVFDTAARYTETATGGGTSTFNTVGLTQTTSATATSGMRHLWSVGAGGNHTGFAGSPTWTAFVSQGTTGTDFTSFIGVGDVAATGAAISYTFDHIGFKITRAASGTISLFATQADGTTENASSALETIAANDDLALIAVKNGTTSTDYYRRLTTGALSAATNLTANLPAATAVGRPAISISNSGVATSSAQSCTGMNYER